MKGTELAKILKMPSSTICMWIREGRFKNVTKVLVDHRMVWEIDDAEAEQFIKDYLKNA